MLRFSPAYGWPRAVLALQTTRIPLRAANDNRAPATANDAVLAAALKLFAANGLCAAQRAFELALDADAAGDHAAADRWSEVCRTLDRGRARDLAGRRRRAGRGNGAR